MRYGSVYILTNRITHCQYVGQTIQPVKARWRAHVANAKKPKFDISRAISIYGERAFSIVEAYIAFDKNGLDAAEVALIADLAPAYNMTKGGAGSPIRITPYELRAKRSYAAKKRWADPKWRATTIAKMAAAVSLETKQEQGKKLIQFKGGVKRWEGHVKKGRTLKSRSETVKKSWGDQNVRAKRIEGIKKAVSDPAVKAKLLLNLQKPQPKEARDRTARAKYKPVYCPELQVTFISRKHAAAHFGVTRETIHCAITKPHKIKGLYSLVGQI